MKRVILFCLFVFLFIAGSLLLIRFSSQQEAVESNGIKVVASFYPLAHFSDQILGELGEISTLTPPGSDAHSFSPTPQDALSLQEADVFFYNGAGFDAHIEEFVTTLETNGLQIVDMSQFIELHAGKDEEDGEGEEGGHNHHGVYDPHYWQSPQNAQIMVQEMSNILQEFAMTEVQKMEVSKNTARYLKELAELHEAYQDGLADCGLTDIVVAHDAFGYTAEAYGFDLIPLAGLSPQDRPSAKRLGEIAQLAEAKGITHIFFETLSSPELSETLAREVDAQTLVLNPLEGLTVEEIKAGETYITVMEENLNNLEIALDCK